MVSQELITYIPSRGSAAGAMYRFLFTSSESFGGSMELLVLVGVLLAISSIGSLGWFY